MAAQRENSIFHQLLTSWSKHHEAVQQSAVPPMPSVSNTARVCLQAGMCICGQDFAEKRALCDYASLLIRRMFIKGSAERKHYDRNVAVLHILQAVPGAENDSHAGIWLHLGHGNLNTGVFSVLPLLPDTISPQALQARHWAPTSFALHIADAAEPVSHYKAFSTSCNTTNRWTMECWTLDSPSRGKHLVIGGFSPGRVVVHSLPDRHMWRLWPPQKKQKKQITRGFINRVFLYLHCRMPAMPDMQNL